MRKVKDAPRYLLDTNTCIYIINHRPPEVRERFQALSVGDIGISSITGAELYFGVAKSGSARNRQALDKFLFPLDVIEFGWDAMQVYGRIRAFLEEGGTPIGPLDTLIAAHALSLGCILVTNNTREFQRVPDLQLDNWASR